MYFNIEYSQWRSPMNLMNIGKISRNWFSELLGKYTQQTKKKKALYINESGNFSLGMENSQNIRKLIPMRNPINAMNVESPSARSLSS